MHAYSDDWDDFPPSTARERMRPALPYEVSAHSRRTLAERHARQKPPAGCNSAQRRGNRD